MRLSVCVITYNHEEYIEQAITSVLNQDVSFDYEIVVGEDCSTNSTADVLRRLEVSNPGRLMVIYRENNIGAVKNALRTLKSCSGEYIAFLEGDDFWTSMDKLELQVAFLDQHQEASFCFHRTSYLFTKEQSSEYVLPLYDPPVLSSFDFLLQESNPVALNSIVARRAYLILHSGSPILSLATGRSAFCLRAKGVLVSFRWKCQNTGFMLEELGRN